MDNAESLGSRSKPLELASLAQPFSLLVFCWHWLQGSPQITIYQSSGGISAWKRPRPGAGIGTEGPDPSRNHVFASRRPSEGGLNVESYHLLVYTRAKKRGRPAENTTTSPDQVQTQASKSTKLGSLQRKARLLSG